MYSSKQPILTSSNRFHQCWIAQLNRNCAPMFVCWILILCFRCFGPDTARSAAAQDAQTLIQSETLLEEVRKNLIPNELETFAEKFARERNRIRVFYPEYLCVTPAMEALLKQGKLPPEFERRKALAVKGINEIFEFMGPPNPANPTVAQRAIISELIVIDWRNRLMHLETVDRERWAKIKKLESDLFGPRSIFVQMETMQRPKDDVVVALGDNLSSVSVAVANYDATFFRFPDSNTLQAAQGGLSWRVHILPFLGFKELYAEFKLDEPWDSEHNKKLIGKMPYRYRTPGVNAVGKTALHGVEGGSCVFGTRSPFKVSPRNFELRNELRNTAVLVVGDANTAEIWTRPNPFVLDGQAGLELLGKPQVRLFASGDWQVRSLPTDLTQPEFGHLIDVADGQPSTSEMSTRFPPYVGTYFNGERLMAHLRAIAPK